MPILNNIEVNAATHSYLKRIAKDKKRLLKAQVACILEQEYTDSKEQDNDGN